GGDVLAMEEAIAQLEQALAIARSLSSAAKNSDTLESDISSQETLKESSTQLKMPVILLHAPAGLGILSPKAIQIASAKESIALTAGKNINLSANTQLTLNAKESASLFAQAKGINVIAKYGDVKVEAQNDALSMFSKKDFTVQSLNGALHLSAEKEIILNCGGAYIKLSQGNIELGSPNNILLKTTNVQKMGAADFNLPQKEVPTGFREQFTLRDEKSNEILADTPYSMTTEDGEIYEGTSDADGKTLEIYTSTPQKISIKTRR
ncbi:DUF2345 domain-containing protein, partial [Providencia burhodogranariea]